ncbi:MAG: methyltransferase domain-containing protein [Gemmatimonadetes bacterium]|nr:methyltransferase domain-containing protein [Gemmatimonadota bacterium]
MEPFRLHVYACDQKKAEGVPSCSANGSALTIEALRRELAGQGLAAEVQVTTCGSLGLCTRGPNLVLYPEGVWYSGVHPGDVAEIVREHFVGGRVVARLLSGDQPGVRAGIDGNRQKMLASLKARDEAGVLPDDLQQTVGGFRESRVVLTAIELDVFTAVGAGAGAAVVAAELRTDPRATESLLNALVALDLLSKRAGVFTNGPVASRYLVAGAEHDSRAALTHTAHLWPRWSTLTECVRAGTSVTRERQDERPDEWTEAFIAAMHKHAAFRAPQVVRGIGLEGVRRILDLGGGSGAYSIAFAQAGKEVTAEVFDLASVLPITRRHIAAAGLTERVGTRAGDLHTDAYGTGFDLVFLSAICHMNSPEENRAMLAKAFAALAPSGRVAIQDFILNPEKTGPKTGVLFALNMLTGTRAGSSYSEDEYAEWLAAAGFTDVHRVSLPGPTDLVIGTRP